MDPLRVCGILGQVSDPTVRYAPRGRLARFVREVRLVTRDGVDRGAYVRLPDGEVELIVRLMGTRADAHVIGTRLHALHKGASEVPPQAIAVRFAAGAAYPFFGVPVSELTDRVVSLDTLWREDGARLRERILEAAAPTAKLGVLEDVLLARLRRDDVFEPASAPLVRRAVDLVTNASEPPRIPALAHTLGVSERQLRRAFDDVVGMGPKAFARVIRFQRAIAAARRAGTPDWGAIATAAGYYDQAHLIAEFRSLTGATPTVLLGRTSDTRRAGVQLGT